MRCGAGLNAARRRTALKKLKAAIPFGKTGDDDEAPARRSTAAPAEDPAYLRLREEATEVAEIVGRGLGGGLLGRAAGAMVGGALAGLGASLRATASASSALHASAAEAVTLDPRVVQALGSPLVTSDPTGLSSSSLVVDGVPSQAMTLHFVVRGPRGAGVAVVRKASAEPADIAVTLPGGRVIRVSSGGSGGGGDGSDGGGAALRVIDVKGGDYKVL